MEKDNTLRSADVNQISNNLNETQILTSISIEDVMSIENEICEKHNSNVQPNSVVGKVTPIYDISLFTDWHICKTKSNRIKLNSDLRNRYVEFIYAKDKKPYALDRTFGVMHTYHIGIVREDGVVSIPDVSSGTEIYWRLMWIPKGFINDNLYRQ